MTIREWAEEYCFDRGMFPDQAAAVVTALVADPISEPMRGRWDHDVSGYPRPMLTVLAINLNATAVAWIDANRPQAWYREAFTTEVMP